MGLSGRIFGFNSGSLLVPQALEGVAAAGLLCATVRRAVRGRAGGRAGAAAGLIAAAAMALTPAAVRIFRFDNPDAFMVLLVVVAAYCTYYVAGGGTGGGPAARAHLARSPRGSRRTTSRPRSAARPCTCCYSPNPDASRLDRSCGGAGADPRPVPAPNYGGSLGWMMGPSRSCSTARPPTAS
jgi:hypothetical protein